MLLSTEPGEGELDEKPLEGEASPNCMEFLADEDLSFTAESDLFLLSRYSSQVFRNIIMSKTE